MISIPGVKDTVEGVLKIVAALGNALKPVVKYGASVANATNNKAMRVSDSKELDQRKYDLERRFEDMSSKWYGEDYDRIQAMFKELDLCLTSINAKLQTGTKKFRRFSFPITNWAIEKTIEAGNRLCDGIGETAFSFAIANGRKEPGQYKYPTRYIVSKLIN
jgi:hypothetical protein